MNDVQITSTSQSDRFDIRADASQPLHMQVAERLRNLATELGTGERLPSEADLVARFDVSRTTVRRAIKALAEEGVLDVQHGRGTFVAAHRVTQSMGEFGPFVESLATAGERSTELLDIGWRTGWAVPSAIGGPDLPGFGFRWLHRIDGRAHALFDCTLPIDIGRRLDQDRVATTPIYKLLQHDLGIIPHAADFTFTACDAADDVAGHLGVAPSSSLLVLDRTTTDRAGEIIECGRYYLVPELHRIRLSASASRLASVMNFNSRT